MSEKKDTKREEEWKGSPREGKKEKEKKKKNSNNNKRGEKPNSRLPF
jgi:hypothetical protein